MGSTNDGLPRWAQIIIAAFVVGALIWALVPRRITWLPLGIGIAILGAVTHLVYARQGLAPLISLAKTALRWATGTQKTAKRRGATVPPLSRTEIALFLDAVENRCKNPTCQRRFIFWKSII